MSKKRREKKLLEHLKDRSKKSKKPQKPPLPMGGGMPSPSFLGQPMFADIEAPEGFRPVTATQALMEFAQPILERAGAEEIEDVNQTFGIAVAIWNFANPKVTPKPPQDEIIEQIADILDLDETEAIDLFDQMMERRQYLFPEEIQPAHPMTMFMRKEVEYQITPFDERQLNLSEASIPPDAEDQKMLKKLRRLDQHLVDGDEYDEWEALYLEVEKECCDSYYKWLIAKGAPEQQRREFPFCVEIFLNFTYRYNGKAVSDVADFEVEEFFLDHVLRKVVVQPDEYVSWPPALRLFYTFLTEKGYLDNPRRFSNLITALEPEFIEVVKKQC